MKRLLLILLISGIWLLISPVSYAIVDSNENDMSDLWEKQYNSGQLYPPSFFPLDDADGDGVSNQDESIAGTDPADGKPPDGFFQAQVIHSPAVYITGPNGPEIFSPQAFTISWATVMGKRYTLLYSPDLSAGSWTPIGDPVLGYGYDTGTVVAPSQVGGGMPDKLFWRVAVDDIDTDGDDFNDYEEYQKGTDPNLADHDDDGLPDAWEVLHGLSPNDNGDINVDEGPDGDPDSDTLINLYEYWYSGAPLDFDTDDDNLDDFYEAAISNTDLDNADTDGDQLTDDDEVLLHLTDPTLFDTDQDGLPDGFEVGSIHLDPLVHNNSANDSDQDGLSDIFEATYGFNPDVNDSTTDPDGDGLTTAQEAVYGTDPNDDDIDRDGLNDKQEKEHLPNPTNPWNWDTDGDSLPDKWELDYELDPTSHNNFNADNDQDGLGLHLEYRNGTNPNLGDTDIDGTPDGVEVAANTSPNDPDWGGTPPAEAPPAGSQFASAAPELSLPETYQAAFEVRAYGKKPTQSCAVCHKLEVQIDGKLYGPNEPATLLKGKTYDIRVKNTPVNLIPAGPEPPHIDNATFTVWPMPVGTQTVTAYPAESTEPDAFIATQDGVLQYIIGNDEKLLVQDKEWPDDKAGEPTNKKATFLAVEAVSEEKNPISQLKVGKMSEAGVLNGAGASATLDIEKDSDRFFLRVKDGGSIGGISLKISTVENPDATYNDDATQIDLVADEGDAISKSMLLVSDDVDDDHAVEGINDDVKNDRTHKVQLGGNFKIEGIKIGSGEWQTMDMKFPVKVEKTVNVKLVNCKYGGFFRGPCWEPGEVTNAKQALKERYAQTGINLIIAEVPGPWIGISGWLDSGQYPTEVVNGVLAVPQKTQDIIDDGPPLNQNQVVIYLVGRLNVSSGVFYNGVAIPPKYISDANVKYGNKVLVGSQAAGYSQYFTSSHELLHILLDAKHDDYETEYTDDKMLWHETVPNVWIDGTKRISPRQNEEIQTNPLVQ